MQISNKRENEIFEYRAKVVSSNIERIRKKAGYSQMELAYLINSSQSVIHYAEKGRNRANKAAVPDLFTLEKIAMVCMVELTDIIFPNG